MRIAHLIMVHKNAKQVERLLQALDHESFDFYVHLDAKADMEEFAHLGALPRVYFIQTRTSVRWASFQFVESILASMREILATGIPYGFINLLSGQDYPVKPAESIYRFFVEHQGQSFLSVEKEGSAWWQHAIHRVQQYHTVYYKFPGQYQLQALANRLLPKRRFPLPYTLYGGADGSWWSMSLECARYLVHFVDTNPALRQFSRFTWGSDEFLISTILMNSPFKDTIVDENYRYIDWSAGGANPKVLTTADASSLLDTYKLFARKFDISQDENILDILDQSLRSPVSEVLAK